MLSVVMLNVTNNPFMLNVVNNPLMLMSQIVSLC
jgi:hypothetical protein